MGSEIRVGSGVARDRGGDMSRRRGRYRDEVGVEMGA